MVRVDSRPSRPRSTGPASVRHHAQLTNTVKRPHKVVMEEVTQQKKNLITVESHSLEPPEGYVFIAAGDPELTAQCKEFARLKGSTVYVVSTSGTRGNELSQQVHRVGYHFPSDIVHRACVILDIDLDKLDDFLRRHEEWPEERPRPRRANPSRSKRIKKSEKKMLDFSKMSQADLDAQAKSAILDMFPAIPTRNLHEIIDHAFKIGTDRVGVQVSELSLPRRAQLAVVAHIRHTYTEYDELLKEMSWSDARKQVAPRTLEKLALWRGDKDDEPDTMEDILREVIIISDDEDDEDEEEDEDDELEFQETSKVTEPQAQVNKIIRKPRGPAEPLQRYQSTQELTGSTRAGAQQPHVVKQNNLVRHTGQVPRRNERFEVWERTRGRLRTTNSGLNQTEAFTNPREISYAHPPTRDILEGSRPVVYTQVPHGNRGGHYQVEKGSHVYQSYNHVKEGIPRPYDSTSTLTHPISPRFDTAAAAANRVRFIDPQLDKQAQKRISHTRPNSAQGITYIRAPPKESSLRDTERPDAESDFLVPSIETPRATKHQDLRNAIEIDSPTSPIYEKQVHYQLVPLAEPRVRPGSSSLKRRRPESPSDGPEVLQKVMYKAVDPKTNKSHLQLFTPSSSSETKNQGKIVYLPVAEDVNSSTFFEPAPASALQSRSMLKNHEQISHNLSSKTSNFNPVVLYSDRTGMREEELGNRYTTNEPQRATKQPRLNSQHNTTLSSHRAFGDHSMRQVYIAEQPLSKGAQPRRDGSSNHREAPIENHQGQQQGQTSWSQKRPRRELPLDQPFVTNGTISLNKNEDWHDFPRTEKVLGRNQQPAPRETDFAPNSDGIHRHEYPEASSIMPHNGVSFNRFSVDFHGGQDNGRFPVPKPIEQAYVEGKRLVHPGYKQRYVEEAVPRGNSQHGHRSSVIMLD